MSHPETNTNPAALLAAANSFVADTAVKLDRLDQRTTAVESGLNAANTNTAQAVDSLSSRLDEVAASEVRLQLDFDYVSSRVGNLEKQTSAFATAGSLEAIERRSDKECTGRHELSLSRINACEEDYERLRLRIDAIERNVKPRRNWSWTFGAAMFSVGVMTAAVISRLPN